MKSRIVCIIFSALFGTSVFWAEVLDNYMIKANVVHDAFVSPLVLFLFLLCVPLIALIRLLFVIVALCTSKMNSERKYWNIVCPSAILICAYVGYLFPYQLNIFGDKVFFWLNEGYFKREVARTKSETSPVAVLNKASANFYKKFLYSPSKVPSGLLNAETIRSLGQPLEDFPGCRMVATPLGERFYIITIQC
jgi:hypothetical protein